MLDKKGDTIGVEENNQMLAVMRRSLRKISVIKQLQQEFPDMDVDENPEEDKKVEEEKNDKVGGLKKFKKVGTTIRLVSSLSANSGIEGPETREIRDRHKKTRRAALITENGGTDGSVDIKRKLEKVISEKKHSFVLHPHSSFRFYWDMISIIVLMVNVVTIPLGTFFKLLLILA